MEEIFFPHQILCPGRARVNFPINQTVKVIYPVKLFSTDWFLLCVVVSHRDSEHVVGVFRMSEFCKAVANTHQDDVW